MVYLNGQALEVPVLLFFGASTDANEVYPYVYTNDPLAH